MERKLTTILAADVVGYTRLMGEDEAGTLAALKSHRKELIDPKAVQYNGRTIKLMGDGALMEFPSVTEAVTFAVEVQLAMRARNEEITEDRQILFRIGINIGDVIIEGDDIYGDGVNLAARLESIAEPGGICVRRAVRNQVRDKLELDFEDRGEIEVKNVARPVRVFAVALDKKAETFVTPIDAVSVERRRRRWPAIAASLALSTLAVAGLLWWQPLVPDVEPAAIERFAFPLPEKPSLAVLPFDNLSGDPEQEYLSDGLTEEIITALSKSPNLFVIARSSSFTYKGKAAPVKQVAEDLGVRYVLEGSVQQSGDRVRINTQLIDALKGNHLWAERYDRMLDDIFALQDDVTQNIMIALQVELTEGENLRLVHARAANSEVFEYMQKSRAHYNRFNKEDNAIAREMAAKAAEISPDYPHSWAWRGYHHLNDFRFGWSANRRTSFEKAVEFAEKAYGLEPDLAVTNGLLGVLNVYRGRYDEAISYAQKSVDLAPGDALAIARLAWILSYAGRPNEAIPLLRQAMRLSPYYPPWFLATLGLATMMTGDLSDAIAAHEELVKRKSMLQFAYSRLAAIHAVQGKTEKAQHYANELLGIKPDFTISGWSKVLLYKNQEDRDWELDALRNVALPEG